MEVPDIRNAEHAWSWLLERVEEALFAGLTPTQAQEAVRAGISSIEADISSMRELGQDTSHYKGFDKVT